MTENMSLPDKYLERGFIGASDVRIIMSDDEPGPLCPGRESGMGPNRKTPPVSLFHFSPMTAPMPNHPQALFARRTPEFVAALAAHPPRTIPLDADAIDLEDRADHLRQAAQRVVGLLAVILDDTSQNVPGSLDLRDAEAVLADLASDVTGAIQRAADDMAGRPA